MSDRKQIITLKRAIVDKFTSENWLEIGLLTNCSLLITDHYRLLRSLSFGDEDYAGCVLDVLVKIIKENSDNVSIIDDYISETFGEKLGTYIGSKHVDDSKKIVFSPSVFRVPDAPTEDDRIAAMMPFSGFDDVYKAMGLAAKGVQMKIDRADTVWEDSAFIQDIFNLIFRSNVVIVDLTGKNPNVMYEMGIAHTLGKHVIPITQNISDIPSDLGHHRALKYLNNSEGLTQLTKNLGDRLASLYIPPKAPWEL